MGTPTFLDGIGAPGFLVEQIADGQYDGSIVGSNGATVPGAGSVASISGLTHVAWISQKRIAGVWFGAEVLGSEPYVTADAQGRQGDFGDLTVAPFILQGPQRHLLGMPIDQRSDANFDLPVGYYSPEPGVNLGSNTFRVHPYYAITAHPAKQIETRWRVHYAWTSENTAPPLRCWCAVDAGGTGDSLQRDCERVQGDGGAQSGTGQKLVLRVEKIF